MTSKLTITDDKLSALLSEMERSFTGCQRHGYIDAAEEYTDMISALRELQERRKTEKDSEPVAWMHNNNDIGIPAITVSQKIGHYWMAEFENVQPLYRHAQPAPVVPDEMDRIGAFDMFDSLPDGDVVDCVQYTWNACRAAMLQAGNSPVIPDGYVMVPKEPTQAMCAAFNDSDYGRKSLRERYVAMLAAAAHDTPALNSVQSVATVPGKWVPVSERMPETDGNYWGWWSESKRQGPVWFIKSELQAQFQSHEITHWMPLPADPQEVNHG
ncbi:TPA: DUF551 domain-containing protein [Raoultella ornithinolytica]|nr:DUF551 domain-containing protein [Raoultella ornithinolytica]